MTRRQACRRGVTLAELMVVIVILGVMAAVTGIAFGTRAPVPHADAQLARIAGARAEAVRSGRAATNRLDIDGAIYVVTAFADGRVVTNAPIGVDPLSGRVSHDAR